MIHGTVTYQASEKRWRIDAPPHVIIKLKRVFGKLSRKRHDTILLSDTEENARDLAWFLDRYPMDVTERARLDDRAAAHRERMALVDRLLSMKVPPPEFELEIPPREYQRVAAALALATGGLLLADDVGVGKTISAICMLADPRTIPALIVTLTHLPKQWEREINRFAPKLRTHILTRGKPYDLTIGRNRGAQLGLPGALPDVIITNYHKLSGWAETLAPIVRMVCFDEGHELRNAGGGGKPTPAKYTAAQHIASCATFRLAMTATPIFNYGNEFHSVMEVIRPNALGTKTEFGEEWCKGATGDKARIDDPAAFGSFMRTSGLMLRRTRKDVGRELPDLTKVIHQVDADTAALDKVSKECAELARTILKQGGETVKGEKLHASEQLSNRLRQATGIAKCMAPGTRVIRFDGSTVAVEDVRPGDLLMGPDSRPRRVLSTTSGHGEMFEVSSTATCPSFEPYVVNGEHILALKHSGPIRPSDRALFAPHVVDDHVEISVGEYLTKSKHFRRLLKSYKVGVEFPARELPVDPYFLGLWLGDGTSRAVAVTTADPEIRNYLSRFAEKHGLRVRVKSPGRTAPTYHIGRAGRGGDVRRWRKGNRLRAAMTDLGVLGRKHIPEEYLTASTSQRMALLAGLVDSDGHLECPGVYTIATKWTHLAEEICRLASSLGLAAKRTATVARNQTGSFPSWRVSVYGNGLEHLPLLLERKRTPPRRQVKDPTRSGIAVRSLGEGPYFGFALEGDGLFLLRDFTVTHNSPFVADFVRMLVESGEKVLVAGWHREFWSILLEKLADLNPVMFTGSESPAQKEESRKAFVDGKAQVLLMSLRAGAGLDGLQKVCRTIVIGELDWSPAMHEQFVGRVHRDGQADPVVAYFLIADEGSDPIVVDVLGLKREQLEGVRNPESELVERLEVDGDRIKKLAAEYLKQRGIPLPEQKETAA